MEDRERILLENVNEYLAFGLEAFQKKSYNTATTLFFKTLAALVDLYVLRKEGFVPTSHNHRFRVLQEKFPSIYTVLDRDFPFYQDSYTKKMNKEAAELLKHDIETIKKMLGI